KDIITENQSKNTYENALFSSRILKQDFKGEKILLITSAFHMKRTMECFKKQGIMGDPYSVDEHSGMIQWMPNKSIIPDAEVLEGWDILMHEWVGYLSYKIMGYA